MKVALITLNAREGDAIGRQVLEKYLFFRDQHAEVVICLEDSRKAIPQLVDAITVANASSMNPAWFEEYDLIIFEYGQYYSLLELLPIAAKNSKVIVDYHSITPPHLWHNAHDQSLAKGRHLRPLLWHADLVLVHSHFVKQELLSSCHIPSERTRVIPLPISINDQCDHSTLERIQNQWNSSHPILLFVGRLAPNKQLATLIDAVAQVRDDGLMLNLMVIGDNTEIYELEEKHCMERVRDLGLQSQIHFLGKVDDDTLCAAYKMADLFVMPSLWEGFCMPLIEAMHFRTPVLASRCTALPETVGNGGWTFAPRNSHDLAKRLQYIFATQKVRQNSQGKEATCQRIAVVIGHGECALTQGAERSLLRLAGQLSSADQDVQVLIVGSGNPTSSFSEQTNIPADRIIFFPVESGDPQVCQKWLSRIEERPKSLEMFEQYAFIRSLPTSTKLLDHLRDRLKDYDAVFVGPYLSRLSFDVANLCKGKCIVIPCFHEEKSASLSLWHDAFDEVGGLLFHSPWEQHFAQAILGFNSPNHAVMQADVTIPAYDSTQLRSELKGRSYVVYCGRFTKEKNCQLLLDFMERFNSTATEKVTLAIIGTGSITIPNKDWVISLGSISESEKFAAISHAQALIQLSTRESMSYVCLEAMACGIPLLGHQDCGPIESLINRANCGKVVGDFDSFQLAIKSLLEHNELWKKYGKNGQHYFETVWSQSKSVVEIVMELVDNLDKPLLELGQESAFQRSQSFTTEHWRKDFSEFLQDVVQRPKSEHHFHIECRRRAANVSVSKESKTCRINIKLINRGNTPILSEGANIAYLHSILTSANDASQVINTQCTKIRSDLLPGQRMTYSIRFASPTVDGDYHLRCFVCQNDNKNVNYQESYLGECKMNITVASNNSGPTSELDNDYDTLKSILEKLEGLKQLPDDYHDISTGSLSNLKKSIKKKLLHNFKVSYVDVLSRQQSQVNHGLISLVQELIDHCQTMEQRIAELEERLQKHNESNKDDA